MKGGIFIIIEKISDAELEVMRVIWLSQTPTTYAQIRAALGGSGKWDTSTIRTLILRLVEKKALIQEKKDVYYYTPAISEEEFIKGRTEEFLRKVYGGSAKNLVSAMLADEFLSAGEIDEIKNFWEKGKNEK